MGMPAADLGYQLFSPIRAGVYDEDDFCNQRLRKKLSATILRVYARLRVGTISVIIGGHLLRDNPRWSYRLYNQMVV